MNLGAQRTPDLPAVGNCYEDNANTLLMHPGFRKGWVLVHGHPTRTIEPYCQFGHAWLEKGKRVFDAASGRMIPRDVYYRAGNIDYKDNRLYTRDQTRQFVLFSQHWGPWEGPDADPIPDERVQEWLDEGRTIPKRTRKAKR